MQNNFSEINIDKYIEWYKKWSREIIEVPKKAKKLDSIIKEADYLEYNKKSKQTNETRKRIEELDFEADKLKDEMRPFSKYFDGYNNNYETPFYIPSHRDWEKLEECRSRRIEENTTEYNRLIIGSPYTEEVFATTMIDEVKERINDSFFLRCINNVLPIEKSGLDNWWTFCFWVSDIDFANWISKKLFHSESGLKDEIHEPKTTLGGVALYYWYLARYGGDGLLNTDILKVAHKKYGFTQRNLKDKYRKIVEGEIAMNDTITNVRTSRLTNLKCAYYLLVENKADEKSINLAFAHLTELETKIKSTPKA